MTSSLILFSNVYFPHYPLIINKRESPAILIWLFSKLNIPEVEAMKFAETIIQDVQDFRPQ